MEGSSPNKCVGGHSARGTPDHELACVLRRFRESIGILLRRQRPRPCLRNTWALPSGPRRILLYRRVLRVCLRIHRASILLQLRGRVLISTEATYPFQLGRIERRATYGRFGLPYAQGGGPRRGRLRGFLRIPAQISRVPTVTGASPKGRGKWSHDWQIGCLSGIRRLHSSKGPGCEGSIQAIPQLSSAALVWPFFRSARPTV